MSVANKVKGLLLLIGIIFLTITIKMMFFSERPEVRIAKTDQQEITAYVLEDIKIKEQQRIRLEQDRLLLERSQLAVKRDNLQKWETTVWEPSSGSPHVSC